MSEKDLLAEEMQNTEEFAYAAPTAEEAAAEARDDRRWYLQDGTEVSKSEFIREQFTAFNKSRKQISEEFDINYRTVYGATANMTNEAEPSTRGRSASAMRIKVTPNGDVVSVIENVYHINNEAVEDEEGRLQEAEATEVDRNTWIKEQVAQGRDRSEVAKVLGLSYGVVYSVTKDVEGTRQRHEVEYQGELISRSEYIRRRYAEGVTKADIAKELGVDYPVVWSALKSVKSVDEKFSEAIDKIAKFADVVEDVDAFNALVEQLRGVALKQQQNDEGDEDASEVTE